MRVWLTRIASANGRPEVAVSLEILSVYYR
jgi:hypothetical protein